jgi:catechol 2,3-dioxygenase-like lactoylglutathione lyase family enzyme
MEKTNWRGFHHVALVTADLDATIAFYEHVLGMKAGAVYPSTAKRGRHCFIKPGDTEAWGLHFFEYPGAQIHSSADAIRQLAEDRGAEVLYQFVPGALQHIAFSLPTEQEAMHLRQRLGRHGVAMTEIYDQGSIRNFVFTDNNGIQLEAAWPKV